jgi:hypothetical protein
MKGNQGEWQAQESACLSDRLQSSFSHARDGGLLYTGQGAGVTKSSRNCIVIPNDGTMDFSLFSNKQNPEIIQSRETRNPGKRTGISDPCHHMPG